MKLGNLENKSINGVIWNLAEKFGIQLTKVILGIFLARLLSPSDYGLIGMVTVFFVIANVFIDSGFGLAYIQKKDADDSDASTIFYFNLGVSILMYSVLWIVAPYISKFYNEPELTSITRVMSLTLVINSFGIMQIARLTKRVNFKKKSMLLLVSSIIAGLGGIVAAIYGLGVWSLVVQGLLNSILTTSGLWLLYTWRPKFFFSLSSLKSMFSFSSWAMVTNIFRTVLDNIYTLVIGKFFPASELGFYSKANQFQGLVSKQVSTAVGSVAFPVFAQLQNEKSKLKQAIKKFSQHTLFFVVPISGIFIAVAKPLFLLLLTEKWLPMVPYFQLLMIAGVLYPIHMVNVQVLSAQGKVKLTFTLEVIKNIIRIVNISIMYKYGVFYIILGEIFLSYFSLVLNTYYTRKFVDYGMIEQIKDIGVIFISAIIASLIGWIITKKITNDLLVVLLTPMIIIIIYLSLMKFLSGTIYESNIAIIKKKLISGIN